MNEKWRDGRTRENRAVRARVKLLAKEIAAELRKEEDYIADILVFSMKEDGDMADIPFLSWLSPNDKKAIREFFIEERDRERLQERAGRRRERNLTRFLF